ncbi:GIY-YIG nuclease family protein [Gemmatimonas sp.]|uniref:GIY-YIG nuclease family protein n=1 Tax=Gemmatimonas sp. TaxID=1962908 RepID=UPI00286EA4C6|nr:GIY-YIG nuclease family protein [Gemmatimonas sp.]
MRNLETGEALIGRSIDLHSVVNRERTSLRFGGHSNRRLQQDWNARGADAFVFEVLDTLTSPDFDPTEDLVLLETMWRERMQADGHGSYSTRASVKRA